MAVHDRINAAIEKSGMKQKVIAKQIGVSEQTFCAMLSGRRKIYVDEFFKICLALGIAPNDLYGFSDVHETQAV